MTSESQQVPAARRTMRLLAAVAAAPDGLTSGQLLDEVGGSRSGLYALVGTLRREGYLVSDEGRHRPGPEVWGLIPDRPGELRTLLGAFDELTRRRPGGEPLALSWPEGSRLTLAAVSAGTQPVQVVYRPGATRDEDGADALVMAAGEAGESDALARVRQEGAATATHAEVTELAVPVCADGVRPTAALLVGVPLGRATGAHMDRLHRELRRLAADLSYRLGAAVYQPYGWAGRDDVGPTKDMAAGELDAFLRGLWGAQLACVRSDGTPHVVPLWYEWDGEVMWLAASPGASWRSYIADNPRVSVTLDEPWPPLRRVFVTGEAAEVSEATVPGGLGGLRRRLAVRYLGRGADRSPDLQETAGWAAVRILPDRVHGRQGLGAVTA